MGEFENLYTNHQLIKVKMIDNAAIELNQFRHEVRGRTKHLIDIIKSGEFISKQEFVHTLKGYDNSVDKFEGSINAVLEFSDEYDRLDGKYFDTTYLLCNLVERISKLPEPFKSDLLDMIVMDTNYNFLDWMDDNGLIGDEQFPNCNEIEKEWILKNHYPHTE